MASRTRIKICGITNIEDALAAVACGADALGFIRVPGTPRYVCDEALAQLDANLPLITQVAVVRTPTANEIPASGRFSTVQFYEEPADGAIWGGNGRVYMRAFRLRDAASLAELANYPHVAHIGAVVLDAYSESVLGGAGKTFDWSLAIAARRLVPNLPIVLAGGLSPENVADAIAAVRPYAVDVSSGVESAPGRKDHEAVAAFCRAVREADAEAERRSLVR